jgi:hypothetical protein
MKTVISALIVLAVTSATVAAPKREYPRRFAKVDPVSLGRLILGARREAERALDDKDFARYEDWNEKKTELLIEQKLWQFLCTEAP